MKDDESNTQRTSARPPLLLMFSPLFLWSLWCYTDLSNHRLQDICGLEVSYTCCCGFHFWKPRTNCTNIEAMSIASCLYIWLILDFHINFKVEGTAKYSWLEMWYEMRVYESIVRKWVWELDCSMAFEHGSCKKVEVHELLHSYMGQKQNVSGSALGSAPTNHASKIFQEPG